jgi:CRP-like cAMP-binding protein
MTSRSRTDALQFIRDSTWGRRLDAPQLERVLASAQAAIVPAKGHLVRAGEPAHHWVGIADGLVVQQVSHPCGKPTALTAACAGTWFGEGTLMKRGRWQYDAIAKRECHVVLIPLATFDWLRSESLPFNQFIARLLNERLSHYMGLLATERLTQPEERIAHVLASLFDPDLYPSRPRLLPLHQGDFALLAGMSRQRTNAALQRLQEAGLVQVRRTGVEVPDVQALRAYTSTTTGSGAHEHAAP